MGLKNFKTRNGIDVDTYTIPNTVIQNTIKTNSATTLDTIPMASFISAEYLVTITQGSKIRTSKVVMHTDGTSVDMTEYGITETGGTISGVVVSATTSSTNAVLQATITDAATTIARVKMSRNINIVFTPVAPDAPTIGTATGGAGEASIAFTAPYDNGGATISSYIATSTPGSITGTNSQSPIIVTGLTGGTSYTFKVYATNLAGNGTYSADSNSVTVTSPVVGGGYAVGGYGSGNSQTTIQKLAYSNDATSTISATLSTATRNAPGLQNNGNGYAYGNSSGSGIIQKLVYATETTSVAGGTANSSDAAGTSNLSTAGYVGRGYNGAQVDKYVYSTETVVGAVTSLPIGYVVEQSGCQNSGTAGYLSLGYRSSFIVKIYKINFSTDVATVLGDSTQQGTYAIGLSNGNTAGYAVSSELTSASVSATTKITFSTETIGTVSSILSNKRGAGAGLYNSTNGWCGAGRNSNGTYFNTVDKFPWSTETFTTIAPTLNAWYAYTSLSS